VPEYDLGTAHGRIKIDVDDRGAQQANRTVDKLERTMRSLDRSMSSMQSSMLRIETELKNLSTEFQRANKEAEELEQSVEDLGNQFQSSGRSSRLFSTDIQTLTGQMMTLTRVAKTVIPPLKTFQNVLSSMNNSNGGGLGFLNALVSSGAALSALSLMTNKFLGLGKVMDNAPRWRLNMLRFGGAVQAVVGATGFVNWLSRGRVNALLFSTVVGTLATKFFKLAESAGAFGKAFSFFTGVQGKIFSGLNKALDGTGVALLKIFDTTTQLGKSFQNLGKGALNTAMGVGLMKMGFNGLTERFKNLGWFARVLVLSLAAISSIGPAAMEALGKGLIWISNLLAGTWDGVKQLSGAFLTLPGFIAMSIAAVTTLVAAFKGLGDQLADVFSFDDEKASEALGKLPVHLKALGQAFYDLRPKFKELQIAVQSTLFAGAEKQITGLANIYLPRLQKGMVTVAASMRGLRDQYVNFLADGQTQGDTSAIYNATAQAISHMAAAIKPAAQGLRDITVIASQFIAQLMGGMPNVMQKFAEWAALNRKNGNLMRWMRDSWQGMKDLTKGIIDGSKALGKLFAIFATNDGENGLARFAKAMERFDKAVDRSASNGNLKKMGDYIRNLGSESMEKLADIFRSLLDAAREASPVIKQIGEYASKIIVPAFKAAAQAVETFFDILDATHLAPVLGILVGLGTALGVIWKIAGPLRNIIQMLVGAFMTFRGVKELLSGAVSFISLMGPSGVKAAKGINALGTAFKGLLGAVGILATVWIAFNQHSQWIKDASKEIDDSFAKNRQSYADLQKAFSTTNGAMNNDVLAKVNENTKNKFEELKGLADQAPGLWDHIVASLNGGKKSGSEAPNLFEQMTTDWGQSEAFNSIQEFTDAAKRSLKGFESVGAGQDIINKAVAEGGPVYDKLQADLEKLSGAWGGHGENAQAAAKQLAAWRAEVVKAAQDAAILGQGGFQVADGIKLIGDAAGDANSKLSGLKSILEGLGIIKTSSMEAAAQYAQGLLDLSNAASNIIVPGENLNAIYDQQTGKLNLNNQSAINLSNTLTALGQQYQNAIANGTDAGTAYADFGTRIDELTDKLNNAAGGLVISREQMRALAQEAGTFDPKNLQQKLNQFLNDPNRKKILLEAGIDEASLQKIQEQMSGAFTGVTMTEQNGLHGGYADKARKAQQQAQAQAESDFKTYAENLSNTLVEQSKNANAAGSKFSQAFADGLGSNDAAIRAAETMAEEVLKRFHRSPPQKGPLSKHGDAAKYGGGMFVSSYAKGINQNIGEIESASDKAAGAAASGLGTTSMGFGTKPGSNAGKFLGQLLDLAGFASQITGIIQKVTDTVFKTLKFISDPLGEGTFFGKKLGFKKTVSDAELKRTREDRLQQGSMSFWGSGRRNTEGYDQQYGIPRIASPGILARDASKSDIQAAIAAEGQRRGATPEDIAAAFAVVQQESAWDAGILGRGKGGEGRDAYGLFQQTEGMWGTKEELTNPNIAIQKYWDSWMKANGTGADRALAVQRPASVAQGGYDANSIRKIMEDVTKRELESLVRSGGIYPTQNGSVAGLPSIGASLPRSTKLNDMNGVVSGPQSQAAASLVEMLWPQIPFIGGGRTTASGFSTAPNTHDAGLAIDIPMPRLADGTFDMELGDTINNWLMSNAGALGIRYTIWRDIGRNIVDGTEFRSGGHMDHIDVQFDGSGRVHIGPNGTNIRMPMGLDSLLSDDMFGPPLEPGTYAPPGESVEVGPNGELMRVHGTDNRPPGEKLNRATGLPWTDQEKQDFFDQYPKQFELGDMTLEQIKEAYQNGQYEQGSTEDFDNRLKAAYSDAYELARNPEGRSESEIAEVLSNLDTEITSLKDMDTPGSRAKASKLEGLQSDIMGQTGFTRGVSAVDTVAGIASQAVGIASDAIGTVVTGIEAIGAAEDTTKLLVRGISGTQDIGRIVDNVQKFVELGAKVAGTVASVTGLAGSVAGAAAAGGGDMGATSAALGAVSTVASLIQAGYETANAVIDLTQEAMKIAGTYVGDFLGYLVGGEGGPLAGNVKFLLDQKTNQLMAYSAENPLDKRIHDIPFTDQNDSSRQQMIGNINVYGGPGSDPRDLTRQMMYQVNSAQYAGALAY
jgi:hypothetical protein